MDNPIATYEEELNKHGKLVYRNRGNSMLPLIRQDRDLMVIEEKGPGRCRRYDVVLYRRGDTYILHRIMKVLPDEYEICGDHNWKKDAPVTDDQILGVLTSVVRNGKERSMDSAGYRCYAILWTHVVIPGRSIAVRAVRKLRRIKRRIMEGHEGRR